MSVEQRRINFGHRKSSVRETMNRSVREASAYSWMVALGETYFPAFVLASGLGSVAAGLITTLPLLFGAIIQLFAPYFLPRFKSHKNWVLIFTSLQGLSLLPLAFFAASGGASLPLMFLCAVIYSSTGMAASPAWNTWITSLVPGKMQPLFFARRTRQLQISSLLGFMLGGLVLRYLPHGTLSTALFVPLFLGALLCRSVSVFLLWKQPEAPLSVENEFKEKPSPILIWREMRKRTHFGSFVSFLFLFHFATNISSPFVNPYLLDDLKIDYLQYAILVAACFLAKIFTLPYVGIGLRKTSAHSLVVFGGIGACLIPALFLFSANFYFLLGVQLLAGFVWAIFDLSAFILLLQRLPKNHRTAFISYQLFLQAIAVVLASLLGGFCLRLNGHSAYFWLFFASAVLRGGAILLLRAEQKPAQAASEQAREAA
jgi:MFS family permease